MSPELTPLWTDLENRRLAFTRRIQNMTPEQQAARVRPKDFSPLETLLHMGLAEAVDVEMIRLNPPAKLAGRKAKPSFIFGFSVRALAAGRPMPTMGAMTPKTIPTFAEADAKWAAVRSELRGFLDSLGGADEPVMKHPMFGLLSGRQLIELLAAHQQYHEIRLPG